MKETLYSTKFLNLVASKRKGKADWVYAHRPNAKNVVIIVPVIHKTDADYTMFLTTKRPPLIEEYGDVTCLEFPAGLVGDENTNETTEEALKKELLEETGYLAEKFDIKAKNLDERTRLITFLKENDILAVFHYIPLHTAPAGIRYGRFSGLDIYTTTESERLLRLPLYYGLKTEEIDYIIDKIYKFYK